ncbi:large conductance mechanosensitive channel protein MscL [Corynebacterium parakroppenstedtii]|uniref:large conductance mechanosensitive channel protein MscL n=1 Tax=Corynebacterium parakroppenstedtii TaxID=2828363 RepID=UPI0030EB148C
MLKGFRDFIMRGNVIELAIAVVIGSAFTAIVTAFTKYIINPLIACFGGANTDGWGFRLVRGNEKTFLDFGSVLTAVINFLIIAAVVYFILVAPMNKLEEIRKKHMGVKEEEVPVTEKDLLLEIRDLLAAQNQVSTPSQTLASTELAENIADSAHSQASSQKIQTSTAQVGTPSSTTSSTTSGKHAKE